MTTELQNNQAEPAAPAVTGATLRGLHDMAQPLTVLQGSLELALMRVQTVDEYRRWLEFALEQAGRLVSNLEYVQQIVRLQQPAGDVETFGLSTLMKAVLHELQSAFADAHLEVTVIRRGEHDEVRASYGRVQEALRLIFSVLCSLAPQRGQIVLEIDGHSSGTRLQFSLADEPGRPMTFDSGASMPTGLQLAQTIVASMAGEMTFSSNPLWVGIRLPAARVKLPTRKVRKKGDSIHV